MSSDIKLGCLAGESNGRDAVHIAVVPVTSKQHVHPGAHLVLVRGTQDQVTVDDGLSGAGRAIGIADPFLRQIVPPGQRFWMCLYPGSITSLAHSWTHPAFTQAAVFPKLDEDPANIKAPNSPEAHKSQRWLASFAGQAGVSYDELIQGTEDFLNSGEAFYTGDREIDMDDDFWDHYERATGKTVPEDKREHFFRCAC